MKPLLLSLMAFQLLAQDETPVFRATTELALFDVQILNTKTRTPAPPIQAKDLRIFEEGVRQEISHFSRDEFPLSVVLLFDLTDSVRGVLKRLAEGSKTALTHFRPEDEVAVMTYSGRTQLVDGFTRDRARTLDAIGKAAATRSGQPAHFNEAVFRAAMQLGNESAPGNRRVIVWLTDNMPNVPFRSAIHTEIEAIRALHEQGVVVAPILIKDPLWAVLGTMISATEAPMRGAYPPGNANRYAEVSGGQALALRGKNPEERLAQLIDELRARYTVGYRPSDPKPAGTFIKIRVELAPEGRLRPSEWTVLARAGYYRR